MNKLLPVLALFILSSIEGFSQLLPLPKSIEMQEIRLPIDHAMGGSVEEIFDEVSYTALEFTKNSAIQEIQNLWVTNDYYIIFDRKGKSILFFDKDGKYLRKINNVPDCQDCNKGDILFIDVSVDENNQVVYATIGSSIETYSRVKFDFLGNYLGREEKLKYVEDLAFLNGNTFLFKGSYFAQIDKEDVAVSVIKGDKQKSILSFDTAHMISYGDIFSINSPFSKHSSNDQLIYFTYPYDYNLYGMGAEGLSKVYKLILPAQYSLPPDFSINAEYNDKRRVLLKEQYQNAIFSIDYLLQYKNYFFFNFVSVGSNLSRCLMYDSNTGKLINLGKITPSDFNSYLPLSVNEIFFFIDNDDDYLYTYVNNQQLKLEHLDLIHGVDKASKIRKKTTELFKGKSNFNPIIAKFKVKESL